MSISGAHCAKRGESAGDRTLEPPILCCAHRIGHQCLGFLLKLEVKDQKN